MMLETLTTLDIIFILAALIAVVWRLINIFRAPAVPAEVSETVEPPLSLPSLSSWTMNPRTVGLVPPQQLSPALADEPTPVVWTLPPGVSTVCDWLDRSHTRAVQEWQASMPRQSMPAAPTLPVPRARVPAVRFERPSVKMDLGSLVSNHIRSQSALPSAVPSSPAAPVLVRSSSPRVLAPRVAFGERSAGDSVADYVAAIASRPARPSETLWQDFQPRDKRRPEDSSEEDPNAKRQRSEGSVGPSRAAKRRLRSPSMPPAKRARVGTE